MILALVEPDFESNKTDDKVTISDKSIFNLQCPSYVDYIEIYPELDENLIFYRYVKVFVKASDQQLHECRPINTDLSYRSLSRLVYDSDKFPDSITRGAPIRYDCTNQRAQASYGTNVYAKVQEIIITNINENTGMTHYDSTFNQLFVYEKLYCTAENLTEPIDWVEYKPSAVSIADTIKYYYPDPEISRSYDESNVLCESIGGELVAIKNQDEKTFITCHPRPW